jgi:hypothetical protein
MLHVNIWSGPEEASLQCTFFTLFCIFNSLSIIRGLRPFTSPGDGAWVYASGGAVAALDVLDENTLGFLVWMGL